MERLLTFLKRPYAEKGFFFGLLDSLLKALALFVWGYVTVVLCSLFVQSLILDYNPLNKLWWFSYCFFMFFGATWLAYIVIFVRTYTED